MQKKTKSLIFVLALSVLILDAILVVWFPYDITTASATATAVFTTSIVLLPLSLIMTVSTFFILCGGKFLPVKSLHPGGFIFAGGRFLLVRVFLVLLHFVLGVNIAGCVRAGNLGLNINILVPLLLAPLLIVFDKFAIDEYIATRHRSLLMYIIANITAVLWGIYLGWSGFP